jgi:predicted MFS family arabinose efflux permease
VLADYRSRRVIASGGAFAFAVALTIYGLAPSFALLLFASFLLGVAATAMVDATELALVDTVGAEDATAAVARSHLFGAVGDLFGPIVLIAASATAIGWRGAFVASSVVVFAYALWLAASPLPPPAEHDGKQERVRDRVRDLVRDARVWYCGAVALLLGPLDEDFLAFMLARLERTQGLSTATATTIALAWTAGSIVALVITSRQGFRPRPHEYARSCAVVVVAAAGCAIAPTPLLVAASAAVFGYAMCRFFVALMQRILDIRPGQLGTVYAIVSAVEFSGFLLPLGAGKVADAHGIEAGTACYVAIAAALLVLVRIQTRHERLTVSGSR